PLGDDDVVGPGPPVVVGDLALGPRLALEAVRPRGLAVSPVDVVPPRRLDVERPERGGGVGVGLLHQPTGLEVGQLARDGPPRRDVGTGLGQRHRLPVPGGERLRRLRALLARLQRTRRVGHVQVAVVLRANGGTTKPDDVRRLVHPTRYTTRLTTLSVDATMALMCPWSNVKSIWTLLTGMRRSPSDSV